LSRGAPSLVVVDVSTGTMRPTSEVPGDGFCVIGASSDRSSLLLVTGQSALTLDAETLQIRNRMSIGGSSGALSPKCTRFVTNRVVNAAGTAPLANSPDGLILATIRDLDVMPRWDDSCRPTFRPSDGAVFVTAQSDHSIQVWSSDTGLPIRELPGHRATVR